MFPCKSEGNYAYPTISVRIYRKKCEIGLCFLFKSPILAPGSRFLEVSGTVLLMCYGLPLLAVLEFVPMDKKAPAAVAAGAGYVLV